VGVQLRVGSPARVLAEQSDHQSTCADLVDTVLPTAGDGTMSLDPFERRSHGGVVRGEHLGAHPGIG
jgi:hypothetical protein